MTLFQQYAPAFLHGLRLNGSLWTIPVELQFYLLVPLMYAAFRLRSRRGDVALLTVMAASVAVHWLLTHADWSQLQQNQFLLDSILPYLWMFLTGVLMQRNWSVLRRWLVGRAQWWLSGYLLVFGLLRAFVKIGPGSADINLLYLLPLAAVTMSCAMSARSLATRILGHNDFSYGTYIYHMLVVAVMLQLGTPLSVPFAILAVASSAGVGALSWFCVEKPFLRQKHGALRSLPAMPSRRITDHPLPDGVHERVG
jgi:peptidoglycan/LPS O-acetylase OafA/YrhL